MAVSAGHMSTISLACTGHRPGRGPGSEEENLAFSLMMLSRGVREEPVAFHADVAAPPHVVDVAALPSPPPHGAAVPAGVAHGLAPELVLLLNQAPVVAAASQTLPLLDVFAQGQAPGQVLPSPVVVVEPSPVLEQVVPPSHAPDPVLESTQAREHMAVVGPKKAAPKPKPTTKPRKTVAAQRQSQVPPQVASQELLHECPVCHKMFNKSRSLNAHMKCHPDGRLHPCVFCMSTFPSSSALRSHVRRRNTCGGNNRRRLGPVAAAAMAWHSIDLNMPEI